MNIRFYMKTPMAIGRQIKGCCREYKQSFRCSKRGFCCCLRFRKVKILYIYYDDNHTKKTFDDDNKYS